MEDRFEIGEKLRDTLLVAFPNATVLAVLHLADWKMIGDICLISLTVAYTIWRWRRDFKRCK